MTYDPGRPLVFMHVPKTSGTALGAGLLAAVAPRKTVTGFDRVMFGSYQDFDSLSSAARRTIHDDATSLPSDADFVHGHFSFSVSAQRYPAAQFITIFREPRVRLLSLCYYWRSQTAETMQGWGTWADIVARSRCPLDAFLSDRLAACQTDNMILRMLLWPHPLIPDDDFIDPMHDDRLLREAMSRIDRFDHVDVVENDALRENLAAWLGRSIAYQRLNETRTETASSTGPLYRELTDRAFDLLGSCTRLDACLWETVIARRMPGADVTRIRERAILRAVARYAQ